MDTFEANLLAVSTDHVSVQSEVVSKPFQMNLVGKMHPDNIPNTLWTPAGIQSMGTNESKCEIKSPNMPPVQMVHHWHQLLCSTDVSSWCRLLVYVAKLQTTLIHQWYFREHGL